MTLLLLNSISSLRQKFFYSDSKRLFTNLLLLHSISYLFLNQAVYAKHIVIKAMLKFIRRPYLKVYTYILFIFVTVICFV